MGDTTLFRKKKYLNRFLKDATTFKTFLLNVGWLVSVLERSLYWDGEVLKNSDITKSYSECILGHSRRRSKFKYTNFPSRINSLAVIFEKPKKMLKIADFALLESLWSLSGSFARHPVCCKMLGM